MSVEEKKALYRASFCQTYSEMRAPNGEWKSILGCTLGLVAASYWMYMWAKVFGKPYIIYFVARSGTRLTVCEGQNGKRTKWPLNLITTEQISHYYPYSHILPIIIYFVSTNMLCFIILLNYFSLQCTLQCQTRSPMRRSDLPNWSAWLISVSTLWMVLRQTGTMRTTDGKSKYCQSNRFL